LQFLCLSPIESFHWWPIKHHMGRSKLWVFLAALVLASGVLAGPSATAAGRYQPFTKGSYWRSQSDNRAARNSKAMMSWLRSMLHTDRRFVTIRATNLNGSSAQGTTVYYATENSPLYRICHNPRYHKYYWPTDFDAVRIPKGARAPTDNDADMIVYNVFKRKVFWFTNMQRINGRWCASQASVYHTDSNGLHGKLARSTNRHNWGKHGLAPITQAIRWGEVASGSIPHVMNVYIPAISCNRDDVFPLYTGTMCTTHAANSIPAGAILRIRPRVNLSNYRLSPTARIIARALKRYGAVVGDRSGVGNNVTIKLEDTAVEGKGNLWANAGLRFDSLRNIPLSAYRIDRLGAGR
jgi:hypothetical protein